MKTLAITLLALLTLSTQAHARRCGKAHFQAASPAIEQAIREQFPGTAEVELRCEARWNAALLVSFSAKPRLPGCNGSFALVSVKGVHRAEIVAVFCGGSIRPELYAPE
jgi:hypothetical protein